VNLTRVERARWSRTTTSWPAVRREAVTALPAVAEGAGGYVPVLADALGDASAEVGAAAAGALVGIGPAAAAAGPALAKVIAGGSTGDIRAAALEALLAIHAGSTEVIAADLARAAFDREPAIRGRALDEIGTLGPAARPAVPILVEGLRGTAEDEAVAIAGALRLVGGASAAVPPLLDRLRAGPGKDARRAFTETLGAIARDDPDRVADLTAALQDPALCLPAAIALGEAGPAARSALPHLRALPSSAGEDLRQAAARAIERIEAKPDQEK
jgi:hypothetical protein